MGGGGVPVYQASVMSEDSDRCVCVPVCGGGGVGGACLPGLNDVRGF